MTFIRVPQAVITVLVSLLALLIYTRAGSLYALYANAPSRLQRVNILPNARTQFADIVRNCEDVVMNAKEGFVFLSCDPSRDLWNTVMGTSINSEASADTGIYIWRYADGDTYPEKLKLLDFNTRSKQFHPLGIEYHEPSQTLLVINHARSGSCIEVFKYIPSEQAATHVKTLEHPTIHTPNSLEVLSETEFLVTNDHYFRRLFNPILATLETYLGVSGGDITWIRWDAAAGLQDAEILTRLPFANGITRLNQTTLAVSSTTTNSVYLYDMNQPQPGRAPSLTQVHTIPLGYHPDNLSVDTNGRLLITGHPHAPSLEEVAQTNRFCQSSDSRERSECRGARLSWVSQWRADSGVKPLLVGDEFGTSTTAVRDPDRGLGMIAGLYAQGLYVWRW